MKMFHPILTAALVLGAALTNSLQASENKRAASSTQQSEWFQDWLTGPYATGSWFGVRKNLEDRGVTITGGYLSDFQGNITGGKSQGLGYFQVIYLQLQLDLDKTIGWKGANIYMRTAQMAGNDLSRDHIGNYFDVTELATINTFMVSYIYLDQKLFDDRLWLKIGRLNVSRDFASLPIFGLYLGIIDAHPPSLDFNTFYSTAAKVTWGFSSRWRATDSIEFKYGLYQATKERSVIANHGMNMYIKPGDGIQQYFELAWTPTFGKSPSAKIGSEEGYPGIYNLGAYYTHWNYTTFSGGTLKYNYGFYALGQQMIWRKRPGSAECITLWGAFTYSPQNEIAVFPFFAGAGLAWKGLIPTREKDSLILGSYYGKLGREYAEAQQMAGKGYPTYEWVLEAGYVTQITPWLYVTPNVQWVNRPGGTGNIPNALVLGCELGLKF